MAATRGWPAGVFFQPLGGGAYEIGAEALNFGAFIAFIDVNAACFVHYWLHGRSRKLSDFLVPTLGSLICGFIWLHLSRAAVILGSVWMTAGNIYGAIRTRGFGSDLVSFDIPRDEA